ncbi:MAG TPA: hypothetical protein VLZ54_07090, partial [Arenibacter sp.]|nr:hypothetical protein [Arenibacter sp.]
INKTLSNPLVMDINLRRGVDISMPVLRLQLVGSLSGYNYAHIPDFARYYFIRDIQSITHNIWELHLECDVLESYKVDILASNAKFKKVIASGDYGETVLSLTGEVEVTDHVSDITLEPADNSLLSILRWN